MVKLCHLALVIVRNERAGCTVVVIMRCTEWSGPPLPVNKWQVKGSYNVLQRASVGVLERAAVGLISTV